jgi:PiT family inorganic phosphate transporter
MGIITVLLVANGFQTGFEIQFWVIIACHLAMAMGTLFGGWRIVRTMGLGITRIRPSGAFCAQTSGAIALFLATWLGIPVSTTHTITGAIVGVGMSRRVSAVRWGLASRIVWAWVLTIPCSGLMAALFWSLGKTFLM